MCVIMLASKVKPTEEMVSKAYFQNDHGAGIAWREKDKEGKPIVRWKKGLNEDEIQEMIRDLALPFVAHFRIASVGGKRQSLCHPFPVDKHVDLALEGETRGYVLFHNGHWGEWKSFSKETALKMGRPIPVGCWSDSRAMAWAACNYGPGILEWIDEKCVIFGPKDLEVVRGNGWDEVNGVWCSNKSWDFSTTYRSHTHNRAQQGDQYTPPFTKPDPHSKDDYFRTPPASLAGARKVAGSGGNLAEIPFDLIQQMWEDQQGRDRKDWKMSKKQYKRLKANHERKLQKLTRASKKRQSSTQPSREAAKPLLLPAPEIVH